MIMTIKNTKYSPYQTIKLINRKWPSSRIENSPTWCSVDLRDGNQALAEPMDNKRKMKFFKKLVDIGYKEIEVGFPSASDTDFNFIRELIINNHIPDDVTIQVLTQSRKELILKTIESLKGCNNVIIHLVTRLVHYKRVVLKDMEGVKKFAIDGAKIVNDNIDKLKQMLGMSTHRNFALN